MDRRPSFEAIVVRLTADFPHYPRFDVERIAAEAWALFAAAESDPAGRAIVAEWYARTRLHSGATPPSQSLAG